MLHTPEKDAELGEATSNQAQTLSKRTREFLLWVNHAAKFSATKRLIWVPHLLERETVGAHSYQLCMVAWYVCSRYLPHLDLLTVFKLCLVHDTPEYKHGDTPAFLGRFGEYDALPTHNTKDEREVSAIVCLARIWGRRFIDFVTHLTSYTPRDTEEKRLVYSLDKLIAEANIFIDGGYTDKRLGLTLDEIEGYKRHKIAEHPLVLELHDEIVAYVRRHRIDLQYLEGDPQAPLRKAKNKPRDSY
jgi:5'-deoxynucleotidase YfbR-like HD superfamily hydrolase